MTYNEIIMMVMDSISISVVLAFFSMIVTYFYKRFKHEQLVKPIRTATLFMYLYMLLYVTVFRGGLFQTLYHSVNLIPLDSLFTTAYYQQQVLGNGAAIWFFLYNVVGNILWFIPLGLLASTFMKNRSLLKVICISFVLSFTIEILQYVFYTGISDIDDLIFNVIGGVFGFYMYRHLRMRLAERMSGE